EALEKHPNRRQSQTFLPHPDMDSSDYQERKKSFSTGKPAFNSLGKSLNRNTTGEYIPKFFPENFSTKKKFIARHGQKPEYKSSSSLHVRTTVFKQRNFGSKVGAKFAFKTKKGK
ncbi:MAG: hypothetical protein WC895_03540, partial [Candidatus Shapirobacteria bacterium]